MTSQTTSLTLRVRVGESFLTVTCDAIREHGRIYLSNARLVWRGVERKLLVWSLREVNADAVYEAAREALNA